jgi:hypothetical protein
VALFRFEAPAVSFTEKLTITKVGDGPSVRVIAEVEL